MTRAESTSLVAGHLAMAAAHRVLAETLERWPQLAELTLESSVRGRSLGTATIVRAELRLKEVPLVELLDLPVRCPWVPELLEATLATGAIALWPGSPLDLDQAVAASARAYRALGRARREVLREGELSDDTIDWLVDASRRLTPGPLLDLVERVALEGVRPGGLGERTCRDLAAELGVRVAA